MATDVQDWTQSVVVQSGTVNLLAGATVAITGQVTVGFAAGQVVGISGTPTVQFAAGQTVQITSGTVNIQNAPGTQINVVQPQTDLGQVAGGANATFTLPSGTHAVAVLQTNSVPSRLTVQGLPHSVVYFDSVINFSDYSTKLLILPVASAYNTQVNVAVGGGGAVTVEVLAIGDTQALQVQNRPEQPLYVIPAAPTNFYLNNSLAAGATLTLLGGVINLPHRLLRMSITLNVNPSSIIALEDGAGNGLWSTILAGPQQVDLGGLEVGLSTVTRLHNYAAGAVTITGNLQYLPGT